MTKLIEITSTYAAFGGGKFDSRNRYVRQVATNPNIILARSKTIDVVTSISGSTLVLAWRWRVGLATIVGYSYGPAAPDNFNTTLDLKL